jgi:hypothetical protein
LLAGIRCPTLFDMESTVDRCHDALHRAGWSVGDARILTAAGPAWWASGTNGENRIEARAATKAGRSVIAGRGAGAGAGDAGRWASLFSLTGAVQR